MPKLTVDGRNVEVERGATVLDAARTLGISIPTLCHGEGLPHFSTCMVCAVRDDRSGRFLPSCEAKALDGMEVDASGDDVIALRREAVTLLLAEHAGDCEAPCRRACPAGTDIPGIMRRIGRGDVDEALALARKSLPFPGVLGRTCPAPCENVCRRSLAEGPLAIRRLHGFVAERAMDDPDPPPRGPASGRRVAVVGAGPAGLSAAWFLLLAGHEVDVYEKEEAAGGWMRTGIPPGDLPRSLLDGEVGMVEKLGARFHPGKKLGQDMSVDELAGEADAVLLATGRGSPGTGGVGVFTAGDMVKPGSMVVRAVAQGRSAALSIGRHLAGKEAKGAGSRFQSRLGRLSPEEVSAFLDGRGGTPGIGTEAKEPPDPDGARAEALRCLECDCRRAYDCQLRSLAGTLGVRGGGNLQAGRKACTGILRLGPVALDQGKCILCGLCVRVGQARGEKIGLAFKARGARTEVSPPLAGEREPVWETSARACVEVCPTGALVFEGETETNDG